MVKLARVAESGGGGEGEREREASKARNGVDEAWKGGAESLFENEAAAAALPRTMEWKMSGSIEGRGDRVSRIRITISVDKDEENGGGGGRNEK